MRIIIWQDIGELVDAISGVQSLGIDESRCSPLELQYDERWESLRQSIEYLRPKLKGRTDQLLDMMWQAKKHFEDGHAKGYRERGDEVSLGSWLMQDMQEVALGRTPKVYPTELYRWPRPTINRSYGDSLLNP